MLKYSKKWISNFFISCIVFQLDLISNCSSVSNIIGSYDNHPYAALVVPDGATTALSGPAVSTGDGTILSAAINSYGASIIGGYANHHPYAAFVAPDGTTTALSGPAVSTGDGAIWSVAINPYGASIIGGYAHHHPYVALVAPDGITTALSGPAVPTGNGEICSVAINPYGASIIGGYAHHHPYVALVAPDGVTTALSGPAVPTGNGEILSVAINPSGSSIIGGVDHDNSHPYAVLVAPNGATTALSGAAISTGSGAILSVAINPSGSSIIGGYANHHPYAVLVTPDGVTTALSGTAVPAGSGAIMSVAINSYGSSIVGGVDHDDDHPYAALVAPNGATIALSGTAVPTGNGEICSVAINSYGIAIIGGYTNHHPYAALVAPNGATTALSGTAGSAESGTIMSVAINSYDDNGMASILKQLEPESFGPGNAYADSLFALSGNLLKNHLLPVDRNRIEILEKKETFLFDADASNTIYAPSSFKKGPRFALWLSPFTLYSHHKKERSFPSIRDRSVGGILGFDYNGWKKGMIGCGLAYAYQGVTYSESKGRAKMHQEFATIYGAWYGQKISIQGALFFGGYQVENHRITLGFIQSKASINGGLFSPHLNIQKSIDLNKVTISPFLELDWVNNWQGSVKERGKSGFNLRMNSDYASLLRSEIGLRFSEKVCLRKGTARLEQGVGYVNKSPFHVKKISTYYVRSISTFDIQLFSSRIENLGSLFIGGSFTPNKTTIPLIALYYQCEWGAKQFSNTLSLEIQQRF